MPHVRDASTVASALADSDAGMPDSQNALKHGVAVKTIRRWRREYQHRGRQRGQLHTSVTCPVCSTGSLDRAAYAELLGWYLGDGHITTGRRGVFSLHIYNDARYVGGIDRIEELLRKVKPGGRPHRRDRPGCVNITVGWKHWPCLFPQHGTGRKHDRPIVLAGWQRAIVAEHPEPLLRGLFLSDGCRVTNWTIRRLKDGPKRYEYPRYFFSNESTDIIGICTAALDRLGIGWTLPRRNLVSVARRDDVARLDTFVGPKS